MPEGHRAAGLLGRTCGTTGSGAVQADAVARLQQRRVRQQDALLRGDLLEAVRLQAIRFPQKREHRGMALDFRVAQALLVPGRRVSASMSASTSFNEMASVSLLRILPNSCSAK